DQKGQVLGGFLVEATRDHGAAPGDTDVTRHVHGYSRTGDHLVVEDDGYPPLRRPGWGAGCLAGELCPGLATIGPELDRDDPAASGVEYASGTDYGLARDGSRTQQQLLSGVPG